MKDSGRQKDRQRWERKEWASLVEKHPRRVKASPWGHYLLLLLITAGMQVVWHVPEFGTGLISFGQFQARRHFV